MLSVTEYRLRVWMRTQEDSTWVEQQQDEVPAQIMDNIQARIMGGDRHGILLRRFRTWKWQRTATNLAPTEGTDVSRRTG